MAQGKILPIAFLLLAALATGPAQAASIADRLKFSEVILTMEFGGDLRLRQESFDRKNARAVYRNRFRYRLRFGSEMQLPQDLLVNLRLGSGTGEQVSANQSLDNLSSQKELWVDLVSLYWKPMLLENGSVFGAAGRMQNPLWRVYSSDLIWDDDFNPEGFAQGIEWLMPSGNLSLFANLLQAVADEESNTGRNQWLFAQQAGAEVRLPFESRLRTALGYHKWSDEQRSNFGQVAVNQGNRRVGAVLANRYGTGELTGQLSTWARNVPLAFQATVARNLRARGDLAQVFAGDLAGQQARDGYQFGLIVGRAKAACSWEFAAFKKYSQSDVTVADVADSDFGDGGTNRVGAVFWLAYNPQQWLQAKAKYFTTKTLDVSLPGLGAPLDNAVNRLQLDLSVKF